MDPYVEFEKLSKTLSTKDPCEHISEPYLQGLGQVSCHLSALLEKVL